MPTTGVTQRTKRAVQVTLAQPFNPDKLIWDSGRVPDELAQEWFETQAQEWANRSGQSLSSSRGVFSRWLHFFSLFNGTATLIRQRYGRYIQEA